MANASAKINPVAPTTSIAVRQPAATSSIGATNPKRTVHPWLPAMNRPIAVARRRDANQVLVRIRPGANASARATPESAWTAIAAT